MGADAVSRPPTTKDTGQSSRDNDFIQRPDTVADRRRRRHLAPHHRRGIRATRPLHPPAPPVPARHRRGGAAPATNQSPREGARPPWPYRPSSDGRSIAPTTRLWLLERLQG